MSGGSGVGAAVGLVADWRWCQGDGVDDGAGVAVALALGVGAGAATGVGAGVATGELATGNAVGRGVALGDGVLCEAVDVLGDDELLAAW